VNGAALRDLVTVADVAAEHGVRLVPTLFTGHMSGANWLPAWATMDGAPGRFPVVSEGRYREVAPRSWYADAEIIAAQELLAREAATALRGHAAILAWDLGNENSNVCVPETRDQGRAWLARMSGALRAADPACLVTIGLHMEDLEQDRKIGPAEAAEVCDFLSMHGYPLYAAWARSSTDPALPAFLAEVTRWLGGKDVFFEEFGMPARTREEEDAADVYIAEALDLLYEAGTTGAMLWCFSDYPPAIWDRPPLDVAPHERFFGLWRADGTPKPAVRHLARYANIARKPAPMSTGWIDADPASYYRAPLETLKHLYERYSKVAVL
jgi:endo-1,4-beta-mannosidase